jgi:hypothetical protein
MANGFSRIQETYLAPEVTLGTIPAFAGTDACRFERFSLNYTEAEVTDPDKSGSLGEPAVEPGRKAASWTASLAVRPTGTAGVAPDAKRLFESAFNSTGVVVAGTSVKYTLAETGTALSFSAFNVRRPTTLMQQIGLGCVVSSMSWELGQAAAKISASGSGKWVLDSKTFALIDSTGRGGLSSFPTPPATPVYTGKHSVGFIGSFKVGGVSYDNIVSANVSLNTGYSIDQTEFNSYYGKTVEAGLRTVRASFTINDSDDASTTALYEAAISKTPLTMELQIGNIAGRRMKLNLKGVQIAAPNLDDGASKWRSSFSDCKVAGTGIGLDAIELVWD